MRRALIPAFAGVLLVVGFIIVGRHGSWRFGREIELAMLFMLLATIIACARGRLRDWLLTPAALVLGLVILEGYALMKEQPTGGFDDHGLSHSRPVVGWGPTKPGTYRTVKTAADGRVIYDISSVIDANLDRQTVSAAGTGTIAFFGDSFIYGDGIEDSQTLPQAFADLADRRMPVQNLGFSGWSPAQNLAALQAGLYDAVLSSPRHFFLLTAPWHIERTACLGQFAHSPAPRYRISGNGVVLDGRCASSSHMFWYNFFNSFALYGLLDRAAPVATPSDIATYVAIVDAFVKTAKARYNVDTTVIWISDESYAKAIKTSDAALQEAVRASGTSVFAEPLPEIADRSLYEVKGDGHPTGLANRARAKQLDAFMRGKTSG